MNLTKYEELAQELFDNDIELLEHPLDHVDAFCLKYENNPYICINQNKDFSKLEKFWLTEHELEHVKNNAFYSVYNKKTYIRNKEYKANDALVEKFGLATSTLRYLKQGLDKWEICSILEIPFDLFDHIVHYIKRKRMDVKT